MEASRAPAPRPEVSRIGANANLMMIAIAMPTTSNAQPNESAGR
jgi:hypothetical protein